MDNIIENESELFTLTLEQQRAFNRLRKAYKECEKLGVCFYNLYGSLGATDSNKIDGYGDDNFVKDEELRIPNRDQNSHNEFNIASEWCDDQNCHYFRIKEK